MMWLPELGFLPVCVADEAMPPPNACSTSERKSQEMKMRGYHLGGSREFSAPKVVTIWDRQK
jgi:hypothetical protein